MSVVIVEVHFAEINRDRYHYTPCKHSLSLFFKNNASHHRYTQLSWRFLWLFLMYIIISAFAIDKMSVIEAIDKLKICLLHYILRESSKTYNFKTGVLTPLLLSMAFMQECFIPDK